MGFLISLILTFHAIDLRHNLFHVYDKIHQRIIPTLVQYIGQQHFVVLQSTFLKCRATKLVNMIREHVTNMYNWH